MDCVECFKCRLWGKLQVRQQRWWQITRWCYLFCYVKINECLSKTQGLGTALKILFSERQIEAMPNTSNTNPSFQLSRQEIVSLFNAFGRYVIQKHWISIFVQIYLFEMSFTCLFFFFSGSPQVLESWRTFGRCCQSSNSDCKSPSFGNSQELDVYNHMTWQNDFLWAW